MNNMMLKQSSKFSLKNMVLWVSSFVFLLLFFAVIQLPASYVLNQPAVKSEVKSFLGKNNHVESFASHGTIWNGQTELVLTSKNQQHNIGTLHWDIKLLSLLLNQIEVDLKWALQNSKLSSTLSYPLLLNQSNILSISNLSGNIELRNFSPLLNTMNIPLIEGLTGKVNINNFESIIDLTKMWPQNLTSELNIYSLKIMGTELKHITLNQNMKEDDIATALHSNKEQWKLTGELSLNQQLAYKGHLKLTSTSENNLPDWAYLMTNPAPNQYISQINGKL